MIKILDQNTIDKIAAGEVIERPKSVIKELVENSIDSGASAITVEIKDGGMSFIRVTDNGSGIEKSQVPTAFLRHATSKLVTVNDLLSLSSLGFRGEALSSIAAVSQVELITREKSELTGIRYEIHGGKEVSSAEIGCPEGTTFIARNLFYNTPARKKFMKTPSTEGSYVYDMICHIALSHPDISFKLIMNGNNRLFTSGNGKLKDVIYSVYGRDICDNLLEVDKTGAGIHLKGYIAKPCVSRGNRGFEDYFVNNRYVKTNIVTKAIEEAYRTFVMIHKYPFTVINFQVNPDMIDINIHPSKMEMKFLNETEVYEFTYNAIREVLLESELIPLVTPNKNTDFERVMKNRNLPSFPEPFEQKRRQEQKKQHALSENTTKPDTVSDALSVDKDLPEKLRENTSEYNVKPVNLQTETKCQTEPQNIPAEPASQNITVLQKTETIAPQKKEKSVQMDMFKERLLTEEARPKHRLIGQLFKTYWLIEYENKLYIMDQHAAHEKVKFEELMNNFKNKKIYSQYLMPPEVVTLRAQEIDFLNNNMELFEKLGYQIESFGGNEYKLSAVPANLFGVDGRELFIDFIGSLSEESKETTIEVFIARLSTMACKAAIKGNTTITTVEADALIDQLLKLENPYNCPHGRPTIISMTEAEIDRKFKRIV